MIRAGGKVHIVVAGAAGLRRGHRRVVGGLSGHLGSPDCGRSCSCACPAGRARVLKLDSESHIADDPVTDAQCRRGIGAARRLDARQRVAGVDLVDHHLHVERIAAVGIDGAGVVAHHAVLHFDARAAVRGQRRVTGVTGRGLDDLAHENPGGRAGRRLEGVGARCWPARDPRISKPTR